MDELERIKSGEGSKFNSALADLERIHNLIVASNNYSQLADYQRWCLSLNALYREIAPYLNAKELEELNNVRVLSLPNNKMAYRLNTRKLDIFEMKLRTFRARKKLGIIAEESARTAAMR